MQNHSYRQNRSTETLLLSVTDSLLCKADNRLVSLITLLHQSAAFDTIDHKILLNRLSSWYHFWYQWHCVQVVHILSNQQNTVCFCGKLKLFAFALEIWCSPRFCPWAHSFYPILSESTTSVTRNLQMIRNCTRHPSPQNFNV